MQVTNTISFGFSLLGTSMVIRRLGLKRTLLAFPSMCLSVVLMVMAFPDLYVSVLFIGYMTGRGVLAHATRFCDWFMVKTKGIW